jgi:hypothetical protein
MPRFTIPRGTFDYFSVPERPIKEGAYYCLNGDINQMGIKERVLIEAQFPVTRSKSGTYPGFLESDYDQYIAALAYLWGNKIEGWWNEPLIKHKICSQPEFDAALRKSTICG